MEATSTANGKPAVLIVDDSTTNLRLITSMLLEQGIDPRPISGSKLALAVAKANPPDLILLDIDMPGMDGFELCKALKSDGDLKDIPIIFISGLWESGNVVKGLALGGVDYVTKPFQTEELSARIRTHLRIVALQRQLSQQNQELERLVSERTRDLANANHRLGEMTKLKGDFLHMIAHELRTPANGLLGFADLAFDMCPPSEQVTHYRAYYDRSRQRLLNLISDAGLISDLTESLPGPGNLVKLNSVLTELRRRLPHLALQLEGDVDIDGMRAFDEHGILPRAIETAVLLAESFSVQKGSVHFVLAASPGFLTMRARLDALRLPPGSAAGFFEIESLARSSSAAEHLGLAPVVAQRIFYALGGDLRLSQDEGNTGYLEAIIATAQGTAQEEPRLATAAHGV
jgi:two-component system, sensor histidine kinase and response regulator